MSDCCVWKDFPISARKFLFLPLWFFGPFSLHGLPVAGILRQLQETSCFILFLGFLRLIDHTFFILCRPPKLFTRTKQATVRPQPVLLKKFPEYCAQMLETPTRLRSEYQLLATLSADISEANSCVNGQLPENRRKNRYINILPCKYAENLGWVLFRACRQEKTEMR
jgi:hypothetical protein